MFLARVNIQLKESILDPQGQAVIHALHQLGHDEVSDIRVGKYIEVKLDADNESAAKERVRNYCDTLLSNPVIENYTVSLEPIT